MIASIPLIILACLCVGSGRLLVRRARHADTGKKRRRMIGWALCIVGVALMTLGVLMW